MTCDLCENPGGIAAERPPGSLTERLAAWRQGSGTAFGELLDEVYGQLRAMAAKRLRAGGGAPTLSPTELVHEALLELMPAPREFQNRVHFFATMSLAIRSILVDQARARSAGKRGGGLVRVTLSGLPAGGGEEIVDLDRQSGV